MMALKTRPWDVAEHLKTDEDIVLYLNACFEEGDSALITAALGDVARARGMTQVARDAGLARESLYRALSSDGRPEFSTVIKVLAALGLQLRATAEATGSDSVCEASGKRPCSASAASHP
jgi:probable addiction module antidote protein